MRALPNPPDSHQGQRMPESFPFQPGLLKREASGALCIWLWGPEASRGEASATPGSPPGLLFDFNLIRDFFFSNPALPETVLEMQWVSQRNNLLVFQRRGIWSSQPPPAARRPELISGTMTAQNVQLPPVQSSQILPQEKTQG